MYIYNGILFSHKKGGNLLFVTTWMDFEGIMLNEISQRKTCCVITHIWKREGGTGRIHRMRD